MAENKKLTLAWDWSSETPKQYLSYILRNILPYWQCERPSLNDLEDIIKPQLHVYFHVDHTIECFITGSVFDDTYIPKIISVDPGSDAVTEIKDTNDVEILMIQKNMRVTRDTGNGKHDRIIASQIDDTDQVKAIFPKGESDAIDNIYRIVRNNKGCVNLNGLSFSYKTIIALPHPDWPEDAMEWTHRDRKMGWPSEDMVLDIASVGCHITKSSEEDKQSGWTYSFAVAEQRLFNSLNQVQKHCFRFLQVMHHTILSLPTLLSIHDLKMLFFWICERVPDNQWTDKNLGACVVNLLDELIFAIGSKNLPHYFMKNVNILKDKDDDVLHSFALRLTDLRCNPLDFLLSRNFSFQPKKVLLKNVFKPICDNIELLNLEIGWVDFANILISCTGNLANAYIEDEQVDHSMKFWEDCHAFTKLFGIEINLNETVMISFCTLKNKIKLYKYFLDQNQNPAFTASMHGNLGCMYASYAMQTEDGEERDSNLRKADDSFQMAIAHIREANCDCKPDTWTDYANFLCCIGRHGDAIPYLEKVIEKEQSNTSPEEDNMYDKDEIHTVDGSIQREISFNKQVSVPSVVYSFYLLINAHLAQENKDAALDTVRRFDKTCHRLDVSTEKLASVFTLLGYGYKNLEEYKRAMDVFEKVLKMNANHPTAGENRDECQAIMLSLS